MVNNSNTEKNTARWVEDRLTSLMPPEGWEPDTAVGLQRFQRGRDSRGAHYRKWALTGAAAATCAGVLAFPATRVFAARCVNACLANTGLAAELFHNTAPAADSQGILAIGRRTPAPDFTLPDSSGNPVRLSELRGHVVLLNFWATWCIPCQTEIPWFVELENRYRDAGFSVLAISLDDDGWKSVKPYIEAKQVNYRVMVGDGELARTYDPAGILPATLLIDKAGRIAATRTGVVDKNDVAAQVETLLSER